MTVKYFGKIAEIVDVSVENWNLPDVSVEQFKESLLIKYPKLKHETIQVAVNLKIENGDFKLSQNDNLAVLPPFSGG